MHLGSWVYRRFRQREEGGEDTEEADEEAVEVSNGDIEGEINPNRIVVKYSFFLYPGGMGAR